MNTKKIFYAVFFASVIPYAFTAQTSADSILLAYMGGGNYTLVERSDLRRYDNGKYTGLVSRETRSFISHTDAPAGFSRTGADLSGSRWYDGSFYVMEETRRANRSVNEGIHESVPAVFRITENGQLIMYEDNGYPSFRSFPSFTQQKISPGDSWQAKAERAVDPLNKGVITRMPMLVQYTFEKEELYHGETVYRLNAKWATRYGISYIDSDGDSELKSASGSHNANILVSKTTGSAILVHDMVDETFVYKDGNQITLKGTISLFTEYPPAVNRDRIIPALQRAAFISTEEAASLAAAPAPVASGSSSRSSSSVTADGHKQSGGLTGASSGLPSASGGASMSGAGAAAAAASSGGNSITVENTAAGLRLVIQELQFKPDSAELLPGEKQRLDSIASVLREASESQFLVEGHTASVGNPSGEQKLSEDRARTIAEALSARGIPAGKFICRGSGSKKPIADNKSAEGKARNRRVEITILE